MTGIYKITNLINGKIYIGQSVDIKRRWNEHLRSGQPEKYAKKNEKDVNTPIHKAMQKYGIENFKLEVLEECSKEELNNKEREYIKQYDALNKEIGYNLAVGGQESIGLKGENHSQAKLTQAEINEIKRLLKENRLSYVAILDKYPAVSSHSLISLINTGKVWFDENETYPLRPLGSRTGATKAGLKFTDDLVMEMRIKYSQGTPFKTIVDEYKQYGIYSAIRAIIYGESHKDLPIYKKKTGQWIKPCIDYPQTLK